MNCADARHRILIAEPAALRGETDRALAAHIAGCAGCSADARRILQETTRLAAAVRLVREQSTIVRRSRQPSLTIYGMLAAAALLFTVVSLRARTNAVVRAVPTIVTTVSNGDTGAVIEPAAPVAPKLMATSRRISISPSNGKVPKMATMVAESTGVQHDLPRLRETPSLGVTVTGGQRAAVIGTSNPNITVIWLSKGQEP
jgi:hypothetical protein